MSKITRFDVYGNANYSDRGSLVLYDHHKEVVEALERQLAEAREFKKFVARMIKLNLTHYMSDYEAIMEIDKQLKEQG